MQAAANSRRIALLGTGIKGLRVGVIHHFHEVDHKVSDGTQRGIDAAVATLRDLGATISEVTLSPLAEWHACGTLISAPSERNVAIAASMPRCVPSLTLWSTSWK